MWLIILTDVSKNRSAFHLLVKQARKTTEAEDDGTAIARNAGFYVPFDTASLLRRLEYLASPL